MLDARVKLIHQEVEGAAQRVNLIPIYTVFSVEQALELNDKFLDWGYEGSILRPTQALLKEGRPDKAQQLMRIKGFIDVEARCTGIYEALENQNEAKVNELGRTERSSHKENKIGKNMLGGLSIVFEQDIVHNGEVLFKAGTTSKCGPGTMTHNERFYYWVNPGEIVGQMIKLKLFPQGIKEKARMGTFLSLRSAEDMS
jgi:DNA ligase-1